MSIQARLLLVENSEADAIITTRLLEEKNDFKISRARDLKEALALIKRNKFDVALVDPGLPDSKGISTYLEINTARPEMAVIILAELSDEQVALQCVKKGAQDYIDKKNLTSTTLHKALRYGIERKRIFRAFFETEARLTTLFNSVDSGIVVHASDTSIIEVNARGQKMMGLARQNLVGRLANDPIWHFVDAYNNVLQVSEYPVNVVLKTRLPLKKLVLGIQREQAKPQWVLVNGVPFFDEQGQLKEVIITFVDITERKEAEQRFKRIFEESPVSLWEEDLSEVIAWVDELKQTDRNDLFTYFENNPAETFKVLEKIKVVAINQASVELFEAGSKTHLLSHFRKTFNPDSLKVIAKALVAISQGASFFESQIEYTSLKGKKIEAKLKLTLNENHQALVAISDISDLKSKERSLHQAAEVIRSTSEGVLITDLNGTILEVNQAFCDITGYEKHEVISRNPNILKSGKHDEAFYQRMWKHITETGNWRGEIWNRNKAGEIYPEMMTISTVRNEAGVKTGYVAVFADISSSKASEEMLEHMAHYDSLTSLPNRVFLSAKLEQCIQQSEHQQMNLAVIFIDLDRFKNINDSLGHSVGDELLFHVAARLKEALRTNDTVARISGDEFVVLLEDIRRPDDVTIVVEKLMDCFTRSFDLGSHTIHITASMGISIFPDDSREAEILLKNADAAMYRAKDDGRNSYQFYTPDLTGMAAEHVFFESALRLALANNEFFLVYQPQVSLVDNHITGLEALIRWQHPEEGLISPGRFIPIAEQAGLIKEIGTWVLTEACRQGREWLDQNINFGRIAVNIAGPQIQQADFVELVENILQETGLPGEHLELEVTESFIMNNPESTVAKLKALRKMKIQIAIDDFGTGYSSMSYLKKLPIDKIKIDQSFIREIPGAEDDKAIASAIIALAHSLKLNSIAEGVETLEHMNFLKEENCNQAQGYYFSRPVNAEEILLFLKKAQNLS